VLCFWEDDGQDDLDADEVKGGPNYDYSLLEARNNFSKYMCQYRPDDAVPFSQETTGNVIAVKREMLSTFEEIRTRPGASRLRELWKLIDSGHDRLFKARFDDRRS
jgi:hypothetical protein